MHGYDMHECMQIKTIVTRPHRRTYVVLGFLAGTIEMPLEPMHIHAYMLLHALTRTCACIPPLVMSCAYHSAQQIKLTRTYVHQIYGVYMHMLHPFTYTISFGHGCTAACMQCAPIKSV